MLVAIASVPRRRENAPAAEASRESGATAGCIRKRPALTRMPLKPLRRRTGELIHTRDATTFDVVGIGASAGGVKALLTVVNALPARFPAAVIVVQHVDPRRPSMLPEILARHANLKVTDAVDGDPIRSGVVVTAPSGTHLIVTGGHISLTTTARVHFSRPCVDVLLESLATEYGARAIAVILTGSGCDGAAGLRAVKRRGGTTIVQDPDEAEHAGMPQSAWRTGCVDYKLPLVEIGPTLSRLVMAPVSVLASGN